MAQAEVIAGKYRLVSLLGEGGMGAVWRAVHLDLGAPVAVKLLHPMIAASGEGLARFHREAEAAAALRSPHVVQILDRGIDPETHQAFIVMELMEGESLAGRLAREGRLSPEATARVITHVARALARAHEIGVVHRDLKPDNVFLVHNEDEEIAKVLDFGIAKSDKHGIGHGGQTRTGAVMGTPYYMSPEQISGSKGIDYRADLWALGVIAYECLTGARPFEADSIGGLALKICAEPMPVPSSLGPVPPGFDAWFERAAARDPTGRFQSAREAAEELRSICGIAGSVPDRPTDVWPEAAQRGPSLTTGALVRTTGRGGAQKRSGRRALGWLALGGVVLIGGMALAAIRLLEPGTSTEDEASELGSAAAAAPSPEPPPAAPEAPIPAPPPARPDPAPSIAAAPSASAAPLATAKPVRPVSRPATTAPARPAPAAKPKPAAPARPTGLGTAIDDRK